MALAQPVMHGAKAKEPAGSALPGGMDAHQPHVPRQRGAERVVDVEDELDVRP